ncbi:hypothetical protein [Vibrio sp. CyArs1]|uniref:hypothetical protein n=1 Tax=Vibrio sp. CyArs1 TaxID=2682577 RepID=UPI001F06C46D|nr:hypothetical protein [Vibrio sp. CyArs1]
MIDSPKAFRKAVLYTENQCKSGSLNGAWNILEEINKTFGTYHFRAVNLCSVIERIIQNRSGYLTFEQRADLKVSHRLRTLIKEQRNRNETGDSSLSGLRKQIRENNQIRKQDEAPKMGADSSMKAFVLCQDCLKVMHYTHERHNEDELCTCGGQLCGCDDCQSEAAKRVVSGAKVFV